MVLFAFVGSTLHWGFFMGVACATADWLLAEMQDAAGGLHSSIDADAAGEEGRYYVWTRDEVRALLGENYYRRKEMKKKTYEYLFYKVRGASKEEIIQNAKLTEAEYEELEGSCIEQIKEIHFIHSYSHFHTMLLIC